MGVSKHEEARRSEGRGDTQMEGKTWWSGLPGCRYQYMGFCPGTRLSPRQLPDLRKRSSAWHFSTVFNGVDFEYEHVWQSQSLSLASTDHAHMEVSKLLVGRTSLGCKKDKIAMSLSMEIILRSTRRYVRASLLIPFAYDTSSRLSQPHFSQRHFKSFIHA